MSKPRNTLQKNLAYSSAAILSAQRTTSNKTETASIALAATSSTFQTKAHKKKKGGQGKPGSRPLPGANQSNDIYNKSIKSVLGNMFKTETASNASSAKSSPPVRTEALKKNKASAIQTGFLPLSDKSTYQSNDISNKPTTSTGKRKSDSNEAVEKRTKSLNDETEKKIKQNPTVAECNVESGEAVKRHAAQHQGTSSEINLRDRNNDQLNCVRHNDHFEGKNSFATKNQNVNVCYGNQIDRATEKSRKPQNSSDENLTQYPITSKTIWGKNQTFNDSFTNESTSSYNGQSENHGRPKEENVELSSTFAAAMSPKNWPTTTSIIVSKK